MIDVAAITTLLFFLLSALAVIRRGGASVSAPIYGAAVVLCLVTAAP